MTEYGTRAERARVEADFANLTPVESAGSEVSTVISIRLRPAELTGLESAATAANLPLSTFIRQAALGAASTVDLRTVRAQAEALESQAGALAALLRGKTA